MRRHAPRDIQAIHAGTSRTHIYRQRSPQGKFLVCASATQGHDWLAPVGAVGGFLQGDEPASAITGIVVPGDVGPSFSVVANCGVERGPVDARLINDRSHAL